MPGAVLRAVLNEGNSLLTRDGDGRISGLPVALARFIAAETRAKLDVRLVAGTAAVIEALTSDAADIGFLAVDSARTARVAVTLPFIQMQATFWCADSVSSCAEIVRSGATVAVLAESGPALLLERRLKLAALK